MQRWHRQLRALPYDYVLIDTPVGVALGVAAAALVRLVSLVAAVLGAVLHFAISIAAAGLLK